MTATTPGRADEPDDALPIVFGAEQVHLDPGAHALDASGHVHVDQPPFHLTADRLTLRRVPIGAELDGEGRVAFCPCLGSPLAVRFDRATVAPPHDLVLRRPILEVFGLPIAWAPVVWLRSPGRFGLLPPDIAWRGADGLFVGGGIHFPWRDGDITRGVDLRAGGYVDGGISVRARMRTAATETVVTWDRWHGDDGLGLALRGATAGESGHQPDSAAWDVDVLHGDRAVRAATDLELAARPFDHADATAHWRAGRWTLASGASSVALRGSDALDLGNGGPIIVARRSDALGGAGAYDATLEGGAVQSPRVGTTSFARGEGGALLTSRVGPVGATLALRALGDVADDGSRAGADGAAQARATFALPLARAYSSPDELDPWVHRTAPQLEGAVLTSHTDGILAVSPGRGATVPSGRAWVASAGWYNAVGRWGSRACAEVDVTGGAVGFDRSVLAAMRARAAVGGEWLGLQGDFARVFASGTARGGVSVARARVGPVTGLHVSAHVAERDGVDPVVARTLVDAPLEPASGFLLVPGWTGGALASLPLGPRLTTRAGADVDLDAGQLVAALGALELHDPCNCVVVRATAAHRIGRAGVDVWLSVDVTRP